jgi:signal peptidase I
MVFLLLNNFYMAYFFTIIFILGWHIGLYGMFRKAGIAAWKAFIPLYNTWCIVKICNIKRFWFWLQLIPFAGQFITIWITIVFVMHFGKFTFLQHAATVLIPFIYFPYLGFSKSVQWKGTEVVKLYKKSVVREWVDAAVFAIVAATLIRTFIFEAYTIPSGSMERTLLINDFLFVNKMSYGPRIPQTPLSFPFVHNTMPFSPTTPSYVKWIQLNYKRLPGFSKVLRNDVVVFNVPAADTIINLPDYGSKQLYYDVLRKQYHGNRDALMADYPILVHPMDKTDNYIKRCIAVAGDTLQVKEGIVYINGKQAPIPAGSQMEYMVETNNGGLSTDFLENEIGYEFITDANSGMMYEKNSDYIPIGPNKYILNLTPANVEKIKQEKNIIHLTPYTANGVDSDLFPFEPAVYAWNVDNYGPIVIPQKNTTVQLTPQTMPLYRRIITTYEHNTLEERSDGTYIINGKPTNQYTFKYNYYWMMGDNRHRSQDSRYWGFVPETHIVGKASLIWFSWNHGPRWERFFKSIR